MKRNSSQHSGLTQRSEYTSTPNDLDTLKSSLTKSSNASLSSLIGIKPNDAEGSMAKAQKHESIKKNYEANYIKLSHMIQEAYLEIKHQTIENNFSCSNMLRKSIPFDEDDETTLQTDPIVLFQYIKQIYDKNFELKVAAERELSDQKENGVNDYEAMLQKLEAEVRQHIRIEQQLKLYVESTQAKLDDLEKKGDLPQIEDLKKAIHDLRTENINLTEKLKRRAAEIESFSKDLHHKTDIIKKLEQQLESIPVLKSKIREMESMLSSEGFRSSSGATTLRTYNKNGKEGESFAKGNLSNSALSGEGKSRKNSQPVLGTPVQEVSKKKVHEKDKNKENYDALRMEMAKYNGDISKLQFESYRVNSEVNRHDKISGYSKHDVTNPKTSRQTEKSDEMKSSRSKKPVRSESSSNLNREKSRPTEYDGYAEEKMSNLRMLGNMINNDMIEQSKFGSERLLNATTGHSSESQRKMLEKRRESKARNEYKDSDASNISTSRQKAPKTSRPSTGQDRQSYCPDYHKLKREAEAYDLSKLRASPQKTCQDRSQSVDAKTKLYKEMKSKGEQYDNKPVEDKARRRSAYNIQQSKQFNALNASQKVNEVF